MKADDFYATLWTIVRCGGGEDFMAVVFHLVKWADRQGRLAALIEATQAENPGNAVTHPHLQEVGYFLEVGALPGGVAVRFVRVA